MEEIVFISAVSLVGVILAFFAARWIHYVRLHRRICPRCRKGLMVRRARPLHGGVGPTEVVWDCPECGRYAFVLFDWDN